MAEPKDVLGKRILITGFHIHIGLGPNTAYWTAGKILTFNEVGP